MDAKNSRGFTALHAAASSNKVGAISLLLAAGADVDLPSGDERWGSGQHDAHHMT